MLLYILTADHRCIQYHIKNITLDVPIDQLLKMCKTDGCIHGVGLLDMKYIGKINNARSEIRLYLGHKENVIWKIDSEKRTW